VLVFDVNETLLNIDTLEPFFEEVFQAKGRMREWFAQLILYSEAITLAGTYVPFGKLGAGVLKMVGEIHGVAMTDAHIGQLKALIGNLPVHADVAPSLRRLHETGFRLVTLTNTPSNPDADPLTRAGLAKLFEQRFTVEPVSEFKPAQSTYKTVTDALDIAPADACLVAAHTWDTIGAQAAGWSGALLERGINAPLAVDGIPYPIFVGSDLADATDQIIERWGKLRTAV